MAKRLRTTLPKDFEALLASGDLRAMQAVFEVCDLNARGGVWKAPALSQYGIPEELIRWLVDAGADLHARDTYGLTPLHHHAGSWNGLPEVLIELGADLEALDDHGRTPLFDASIHSAHTRTLIDAGANVHAQDDEGDTALSFRLDRTGPAHITEVAAVARMHVAAGARVTDGIRARVREISEEFEHIRDVFHEESLPATEVALEELLALFGVEGAPRVVRHDGVSPIVVHGERWEDRFNALWDALVPPAEAAQTAQGEAVRLAGRIAAEIEGNGSVNWGRRHRDMLRHLPRLVASGTALDVPELAEMQTLVRGMRRGDASEHELDRLRHLVTLWVELNPTPMQLSASERPGASSSSGD